MGSSLADLDQRDAARVRAELAEVIAARFAYPTFFDYPAGAPRMRPLSSARRQEIARVAQLADLSGIEQMELTAPQVRRVLERLLRRFLELEENATAPAVRWRGALALVEVPAVAAEIQRGLVAFAAGAAEVVGGYGLPRPRVSWRGSDPAHGAADPARAEQSARLIQAALLPRRDPTLGQPYDADAPEIEPAARAAPLPSTAPVVSPAPWYVGDDGGVDAQAAQRSPTEPTPAVNPSGWRAAGPAARSDDRFPARDDRREDARWAADARAVPAASNVGDPIPTAGEQGDAASVAPAAWAAMLRDLTGGAQAQPGFGGAAPASSPFQGLDGGAQSGIFGALPENPFSEALTGPMSAVGNGSGHGNHNGNGHSAPFSDRAFEDEGGIRGLPPGLIQVYSEYLRALAPAGAPSSVAPAVAPIEANPAAPTRRAPPMPAPPMPDERDWERSTMPPAPHMGNGARPAERTAASIPTTPPVSAVPAGDAEPGNDRMIFAQLRNQVDAYLRVMALAAGIPAAAGEPERLMAALARAGRLSAGDERLAEQILSITGRVLAGGAATPDDYRQAFMLYLLFHRGQVGV